MAKTQQAQDGQVRISAAAQKNVINYLDGVLAKHRAFTEIFDKMENIDVAYARYTAAPCEYLDGKDMPAGNCLDDDKIIPPIVVSQVDSTTAYLCDVFLSGAPLFPVVSNPSKKQKAEELETLIDDHAMLGGYPRQLAIFLQDGVKYNYSAIEADWQSIEQFSVASDFEQASGRKVERNRKFYTALTRLDPYNVIRDPNVAPADVAARGDYAGYVEKLSRPKLKKLLQKYSDDREIYNYQQALDSHEINAGVGAMTDYRDPPKVSEYISARRQYGDVDWNEWFDGKKSSSLQIGEFQKVTLYARIVPADMGITVPQANRTQIWKFVIINNEVVVHAKRIVSAYDLLPILFGQPLEDGLGYQTQSIAEGSIPFQRGAATLFNISFSSARRSVSDRAIYDPTMIAPSDINARVPAPKIPVKMSALSQKTLSDAYHQIPFDGTATQNALRDATTIVGFSNELSGLNNAQRGQFQKGNKSVTEWNDTMGSSDNRLRLRALILEHQVFVPLKEILKLNIFQYGQDAIVISQRTGAEMDIKIDELRKEVLSFRMADGYTPKSKLASSDMLTMGFQMISQSPALQQAYGTNLPFIFAHMMQLGGVRGFEEYNPQWTDPNLAAAAPLPNTLQQTAQPAQQPQQALPAPMPQAAALPAPAAPTAIQ